MGQAKTRGTHAERVANAIANQPPHQRNAIFIWDDSSVGRLALDEFMRRGPRDFTSTLRPKLSELQAARPRYIAYFGTFGYSGGLSVAVGDDETLLDAALPRLMERCLQRGGLAAFSVAVDPSRLAAIEHRLAELQPVMGADGHVAAPPLLQELLAADEPALLPPLYGGYVLPFAHVTLKKPAIDGIHAQLHKNAAAWRAVGDGNLPVLVQSPHAERLPDGRLMLCTAAPDESPLEIEVAAADWTSSAQQLGEMSGRAHGIPACLQAPWALHGGELLDGANIQRELLPEYAEITQSTLAAWLAENPDGLAQLRASDRLPFLHEAMPDGTLVFTAVSPLGHLRELRIAAGRWTAD